MTNDFRKLTIDLNQELAADGEARNTFDALLAAGHTKQSAFELMLRVKNSCVEEARYGKLDRWGAALVSLRAGRSYVDLFPDGSATLGSRH